MSTRRETLKNNSSTTLSASVTNVATTLSVTDGSVFPSTGDFRILVDSEIMLVTGRSTNTLTVVRGQEGTTGAAHGSGTVVVHILTADALRQYGRDNIPGFDGSRPPFRIMDVNGNTLTSSGFTTVNLSTSTITDDAGVITIRKAGNSAVGENITGLAISAPATPASVIGALQFLYMPSSSGAIPSAGVGFRQSSSGKLFFIAINVDPTTNYLTMSVYKYTDPTTISSVPFARKQVRLIAPQIWFKCTDDGTNLVFYYGIDGINWMQVYSEARGTFMSGGPDQHFFGANNYANNNDTLTSFVHFSQG